MIVDKDEDVLGVFIVGDIEADDMSLKYNSHMSYFILYLQCFQGIDGREPRQDDLIRPYHDLLRTAIM